MYRKVLLGFLLVGRTHTHTPSPTPIAQKNTLSATLTSLSTLRARGQEGHTGLGLPSKMASLQLPPLPPWTHCQAQREIQLRPYSLLCSCPHRTRVAMVSLYSHTRPSQGALALHQSWAPWQTPRQICNSLHLLVWISHAGRRWGIGGELLISLRGPCI